MRALFVVQGEGRGHLTQAIALHRMLTRSGGTVPAVLIGGDAESPLPPFVIESFGHSKISRFDSPSFRIGPEGRGIDWFDTLRHTGRLAPTFRLGVRLIENAIERYAPDVVVNFYEPLVGLAYLRRGRGSFRAPHVAIAHQHMFLHPRYPFPASARIERNAMTLFTRFASYGATDRLALSLYPAADNPKERVRVVPPLLRDAVLESDASGNDGRYLVYLWRPELLEEVIAVSRRRPDLAIDCFCNLPDGPGQLAQTRQLSRTLTVHPLSQTAFIERMARSAGVATTAGFESTCEAMYMGKPLMMVPTHLEQRCNALDAALLGAGVRSRTFDLVKLQRFARSYQFSSLQFRDWVDSAPDVFMTRLEKAIDAVPSRRRRATGGATTGHTAGHAAGHPAGHTAGTTAGYTA